MSEYLSDQDRALCEKLGCFSNDSPWEEELAGDAQARIRELSEKLATERANADRLAEALGDTWEALGTLTVPHGHASVAASRKSQVALAAHNLLRIDG